MNNLVYIKQNRCLTNSKELAEAFGKQHKNVLQKIERQLTTMPAGIAELNFQLSDYQDVTGRSLPMYEMTKDGFLTVAMTFTGNKAEAFRWQVIEEFNRRGEELEKRGLPTYQMEDLLDMASAEIRTQKARAEKAETQLSLVKQTVDEANSKAVDWVQNHALTGQDIYDEYETIRKEVEAWWPDANVKNKEKYTPGGRTTMYLKLVWKLHAGVKEYGLRGMRALYNRSDINKILTHIIKTGG